ncbi:hypothetical protein [Flavobacterium sp.]|uniref:hypothetical protein n=1 Tax=Flavobacterium sp. TaxID=239 RepID=UPI00286D9268|nr:hypothetical protein [Flavobacterium sp.]
MKIKLVVVLLLFICQCTFSQAKKRIIGKVVCKNLLVVADIINPDSKEFMATNDKGEFSILAKAGDVLVFIADNYEYHRIQLSQEDINKNNLVISLTKKTIALKEVIIKKNRLSPVSQNTQKYVDGQYFDDKYSSPKNRLIYDGSIENGMDFMRMGKELIKLFKNKKGYDKKKVKEIDFKEFSTNTFSESFFTKTLELHEDEVALFLEFCTADPKSKLIVDEKNIMGVMDFYFTKKEEYKKTALEALPSVAK